jgi:hypothetical protein
MSQTHVTLASKVACMETDDNNAAILSSWLRVSGAAEMPQIDQCVGQQFHPVMPLLFELKAQQQPLEFILPREGPLHA